MINNNRNFLVYSLCFLLTYNLIFLPGFTNEIQTKGIFVVSSFGIITFTFLLYLLSKFLLKKLNIGVTIWIDCLLLFLLSELTIFIFSGGEICLFGLIYRLGNNAKTANSTVVFREQRDFAFSISFLISACVCFFQGIIFQKRIVVSNP